ncbi:VOC family protein [Kribbella deserti]|uniref:VOC family protein n=1 Tax=Kribbella deserti TaxID=1926257 RepID=A0ABV6QNJ9_9ACTN
MDWTLEVIAVPVTDVDRARDFYRDKIGFHLDHDSWPMPEVRVVQLTPPGSGCSIAMGVGVSPMEPGTLKGVQLVVSDINVARAELIDRGVEVSEIVRYGDRDGSAFFYFDDPDGNTWGVQEIRARAKTSPTSNTSADG